ncbi:MAG: (Fe-S)-binding protein [Deltaproteobacteria bacterium]|nr:(Fe-S)-binding protein [Deltaproteobacteria bacterium]
MRPGHAGSPFRGLGEEARICARCGACRAVCPTYGQIGWESGSPRARLALARRLSDAEGFGEEATRRALECTLCGGCRERCPAGIDTRRFLLELREGIRAAGREPEAYRRVASNLRERGNVGTFENTARAEWTEDVEDTSALEAAGAQVGYFVGCVSSFYPMVAEIPISFAQLSSRMARPLGLLGADEVCCGFPLLLAGMQREAEPLVRRNLEEVRKRGWRTLVTGCPSCFHTWKHLYPEVAGGELGFEVVHFTEYLGRCLEDGSLDLGEAEDLDEVVTYHDPCDLGRNSGLYDEPRDVIRRLPGVTLVEMAHHGDEALCCGGGGNLQSLDANLTKSIADRRIREAAETGASVLVSACQQCVQVLADAARRNKLRIEVLDLVQLVRRAVEG